MALLEDLVSLGRVLPPALRPVEADLADGLAGVIAHLEHGQPILDALKSGGEQAVHDLLGSAATGDGTVGSLVADVAPAPEQVPAGQVAPPSEPASGESPSAGAGELEAQIAQLSDQLASLQVQLADARKTQHTAEP